MNITVHVDGGSRGNPGPAAAGVVIIDTASAQPLHETGYFLGRATSNVAEYEGLVRALEVVTDARVDEVRIFWLVVLHVTFVGSGLLFALMDWVASLEKKGHPPGD